MKLSKILENTINRLTPVSNHRRLVENGIINKNTSYTVRTIRDIEASLSQLTERVHNLELNTKKLIELTTDVARNQKESGTNMAIEVEGCNRDRQGDKEGKNTSSISKDIRHNPFWEKENL